MKDFSIEQLDWLKMDGLLPAIVQHADTGDVLMLGYMNSDALAATLNTKQLTFYSRSKQRLWRKGETSGNTMSVRHVSTDCDNDSLLVQVIPAGPACHLGLETCFQPTFTSLESVRVPASLARSKSLSKDAETLTETTSSMYFLTQLIQIIEQRAKSDDLTSYTAQLLATGINRCAQKVGEEAVEIVIAAVSDNRDELINETADLIFHLLVLLQGSDVRFYDVLDCLQARHQSGA